MSKQDKPLSAKPYSSNGSTQNLLSNKKISESGNLFLLKKKGEKIQPCNLMDRETLYDENIKIKLEFNRLLDENKKIRSDNVHLQKEIQQYENIIEERTKKIQDKRSLRKSLEKYQNTPQEDEPKQIILTREGNLIITQKKQLKELHKEGQEKDKIIEQMKKDIRISRLQEAQVELKFYQDECQRLRSIIKSKFQQEELQLNNKKDDITDVFKNDNITLSTMLKKVESDHQVLKSRYKEIEVENQKLSSRKNLLEKLVQEKDVELMKVRLEFSTIGKKNSKEVEREFREQLDQKISEIHTLTTNNESISHKLQNLEKRIKDMQNDQQMQSAADTKEKQQLNRQNLEYRRKIDSLSNQLAIYQQIVQANGLEEDGQMQVVPMEGASPKSSKRVTLPPKSLSRLSMVRKRVPKVNNYDIEHTCNELRTKLKIQGVSFSEVDAVLLPDYDEDAQVSISELIQRLHKAPFNILNPEEAILTARYLVEENQEDWIIFDESRQNLVNIVKCVFKNLIKPYDLFEFEEATHLYEELSTTITKYKGGIIDAIKQILVKKQMEVDCCEFEDLMAGFHFCDFHPSKRQQEYLILKAYQQNGRLNVLNYKQLINYFDGKSSPLVITTQSPRFDKAQPKNIEITYQGSIDLIQMDQSSENQPDDVIESP